MIHYTIWHQLDTILIIIILFFYKIIIIIIMLIFLENFLLS